VKIHTHEAYLKKSIGSTLKHSQLDSKDEFMEKQTTKSQPRERIATKKCENWSEHHFTVS
jgi:hypothetical protein